MSYTPPPPPPPTGPGGYGYPPVPQTNQKALWSMIVGIVSLAACGVILGIVAIVLGVLGRNEIRASGSTQGGGGMATAGVVLGSIGIVLNIVIAVVVLSTGVLTNGLNP